MPAQDDNIEFDHLSRRRSTPEFTPGASTPWQLRRTYTFQTCSDTSKRIMPFTVAWQRQHCVNLRINDAQFVEEWLSPAAYTFKKLAGTL